MQTQSKPTTLLLAIIALLLAANLIVNLPPQEATAQPSLRAVEFPHVIQFEPGQTEFARVYRLWSDDVIEEARFHGFANGDSDCLPDVTGSGWQVMPETVTLPPGVRITRIYARPHTSSPVTLLRLRSDGVVEQNRMGGDVWCGWLTPPE